MKRRQFLKKVGLGSVASVLINNVTALYSAVRVDRPNLLIIHTDEHNFRTLGCYRDLLEPEQAFMWGKSVVETPNIDWIAHNGAIATSFYATTPVCSPSRSSFVSGRYPQNTPVVTNDIPMDETIVTFAEILRRDGYTTGYAGKWHLDGQGRPQWAPKRKFGFDDNRYMFNRGHWKQLEDTSDGPRVKARNQKGNPTYDVKGADEKSFTTDFLAQKTIDFVKFHKDGPFCFMVSFPDPHGPDTVRPPYDTMYADQEYKKPRSFDKPTEGLPSWGQPNGNFLNMAKYYGMVKCIDDNVGKILSALRVNKLLSNTIIVFTSDHGDLRGEHHRQNKGVPYEGSAKIPFLIYYPDRIKPGTVVRQALSCVDFLPTIINMVDLKTAGLEQGRNVSGLFVSPIAVSDQEEPIFMRGTGGPQDRMVWLAAVTSRYKIIYSAKDDPWLFDLKKDPDELTNRFGDIAYRKIIRELSMSLLEYGRKCNDPYIDYPAIKTDLVWATESQSEYHSPRRFTSVEPATMELDNKTG